MWRSAITLWASLSVCAVGQGGACTNAIARRADKAVDTLSSWDRVHDWYKSYRQCDGGGPAEGVSEAVARNLVDRWETLPRLGELTKDEGFRRFVLQHVDQTLNDDDLKKIGANAVTRCPKNLRSLCNELKIQAEAR